MKEKSGSALICCKLIRQDSNLWFREALSRFQSCREEKSSWTAFCFSCWRNVLDYFLEYLWSDVVRPGYSLALQFTQNSIGFSLLISHCVPISFVILLSMYSYWVVASTVIFEFYKTVLRRLRGQQTNHQIFVKLKHMICLAIRYYLVKKKIIHIIYFFLFGYFSKNF